MEPTVPLSTIDRKSSHWKLYSDCWEMLDILYDGGVRLQKNVDKFIIRRPKELYDVFYERTRRLTYQDIFQSCVSWHLSKMFERDPVVNLKATGKDLDNFLENCDNCGTSFVRYSRSILESMMLYRSAYVLVDKPRADGSTPLITKQDAIDSGLNKPYLVTFDPRHIINSKKDSYGNLDWIIIKTISEEQEGPLGASSAIINWWIFDRQNYYQYQFKMDRKVQDLDIGSLLLGDGNKILGTTDASFAHLVDQGPHVLSGQNIVPVQHCQLPRDLWHAQRAYLHLLEHIDILNGYSWKLFMCNLPQLTVFSDEEVTSKTLSESGFLQFKQADKVEWLEPKTASFQESRAHIQGTRQEIYRAFHLQAQAKESTATADGASGYSKEVDMMPAVDILNSLGGELRTGTQNVLCLVKRSVNLPATGDDRPDISGYDFESKPTLRDIDKFQAADDSGVLAKSPTLERVMAVDIAMDILSGKNDEVKETVRGEIMTSKTIVEMEAEQTQAAMNGKPTTMEGLQKAQFTERDARTRALTTINEITGGAA